jgi:hypothetical protein
VRAMVPTAGEVGYSRSETLDLVLFFDYKKFFLVLCNKKQFHFQLNKKNKKKKKEKVQVKVGRVLYFPMMGK